MYTLTILIATYRREKYINRLVNSINQNKKVKIIIFNNDLENIIHLENKNGVDVSIINVKKALGIHYHVLNYIKDNINTSKFFLLLNDKDYFNDNINELIDFLENTKYNLITLKMKLINWNGLCDDFITDDSMYNHYILRGKNGDRGWIASNKLFKKIKIPKYLNSEISIAGSMYNKYLFYEPCIEYKNFSLTREYLNDGYTKNHMESIKKEPNSHMHELFFFKNKYHIFNKKRYQLIFEIYRFYKIINEENLKLILKYKIYCLFIKFSIIPILKISLFFYKLLTC